MAYLDATSFVLTLPINVGTITGSSYPLTIGEVATILERVSVELDGAAAAAGYAVPLAPPASGGASQAYAQMQGLVEQGAAWKVIRKVFPNSGGPGDKMAAASEYGQAYRDALKAIRAGELPLVGAATESGTGGRQLLRSYHTSNLAATAGVEPAFDMDWEP